MSFLEFLSRNRRPLAFGFVLSFVSCFGQTWFIGLFKESLLAEFELKHAGYGSLYAAATLASALTLGYAGRLVDRVDLRAFTWVVCLGLALACFAMSTAASLTWLVVALYGLRLFGQGLASHVSSTATSRYFDAQRGKALSFVSLGHPAGEAVLPMAAVALGAQLGGWRPVWTLCAALLALGLAPLLAWLLKGHGERHERLLAALEAARDGEPVARQWSAREVLGDPGFWRVLPLVLAPPFIATGLMFHQDVLCEALGWKRELFAGSFVVFSIVQVVGGPIAGVLVDRFTALRLLPFYLVPYTAALFAIAFARGDGIVFVMMVGMGLTGGMSYPVVGGTWAERYGVRHLGAIRSMATVLMVGSTAVAPPLLGAWIDDGIGMPHIASWLGVYTVVASLLVIGYGRRSENGRG